MTPGTAPQRPAALRAYLLLARCLQPVWRWGLRRRLVRGKETPLSVSQKEALVCAERPAGLVIWGHAVGVGEALALAGLFARLAALRPEASFLITTTARTSGDALAANGLPPRCQHQFSPIDTPAAVARFLDHWKPALAVWCEMDLWPALLAGTDERRIPRVLVNARLSPQSLAKRRWGRWIYQALLPGFRTIYAQNAETVDALVSLGATRNAVMVSGTIKSLAPALRCDADTLQQWRAALGTRPVWLLASSHPGEEALALAAHALLLTRHPDALLIVVPRVPLRGPEVLALCPPDTPCRSQGMPLPGGASVYVADTVGELGLWYRLAPVALVGGSLAAVGGHNPYEPLALGCAVLHGPQLWNFAESYLALDQQGLTRPVNSADQLVTEVAAAWSAASSRSASLPADTQPDPMLRRLLDGLLSQL